MTDWQRYSQRLPDLTSSSSVSVESAASRLPICSTDRYLLCGALIGVDMDFRLTELSSGGPDLDLSAFFLHAPNLHVRDCGYVGVLTMNRVPRPLPMPERTITNVFQFRRRLPSRPGSTYRLSTIWIRM